MSFLNSKDVDSDGDSEEEVCEQEFVNEYDGIVLKDEEVVEPSKKIPRVSIDSVSDAKFFFENYVTKRQPCIIEGFFPEMDKNPETWSNEHMKKVVADAPVNIEYRQSHESYGLGHKKKMAFSDFIDEIANGNNGLYLSAQQTEEIDNEDNDEDKDKDKDEEEDEDEESSTKDKLLAIHATPVTQMLPSLSLNPKLIGNLLLHQINMWLGNSEEGTQSGLHHDYHDNLYVLIDGEKEFTLGSPDDVEKIYTYGKLKKVFKNGRILYDGQEDITPYGMSVSSKMKELRIDSEKRVKVLEKQLEEAQEKGDQSLIEDLEEQIEEELDFHLSSSLATFRDDDCQDDFDNLGDDVLDTIYSTDEKLSNSADEKEGTVDGDDVKGKKEEEKVIEKDSKEKEEDDFPESFSRITDVDVEEKKTLEEFPVYAERTFVKVRIKKNEMLFLPCGWIHNVKSFGKRHLAINYWMYPPDTNDFEKPYSEEVLKLHCDRRLALCQKHQQLEIMKQQNNTTDQKNTSEKEEDEEYKSKRICVEEKQ